MNEILQPVDNNGHVGHTYKYCNTLFFEIQSLTQNVCLTPSPDIPILDSSSSTANKDMMSKMWTNGDTGI